VLRDVEHALAASDHPQTEARQHLVVVATLALYVGAVGIMVASGRYGFVWKSVIVPGLVLAALASRRLTRFVNDWGVFLAAVILFDFFRGLIFAIVSQYGLHVYLGYVMDWERLLCGGNIGPLLLQQWRAQLTEPAALDRFFVIVHASHFLAFLLFGFIVWHARHGAFRQYALAMTTLMYLGLAFYLLVPTIPPWMAADEFGALPAVQHITAAIYNVELPGLLAAFDINPIAAMPSLHAAFPTLAALIAIQHFGWRGGLMGLYALSVWVAIVYLGEHYVVDVIAGVVLAAVVFGLTRGVRLNAVAPASDRIAPRRLALAFSLVAVALTVGQVTVALRQPLPITASFVTAELVGRSDKANLYLGRLAYQRGDLRTAQHDLRRALAELRDVGDRREAQTMLALSAYRSGDFRTTIATLEGRVRDDDDHQHLLLLASAYVELGDYDKGMALLSAGRERFPDDPEPLYWLTRYGFLHGQLDAHQVSDVAERLRSFASPKSEPLRLALQQLLDQQPAAAPGDVQDRALLHAVAAQR
jgi:tetratricopeptide (TPR) repeat protein